MNGHNASSTNLNHFVLERPRIDNLLDHCIKKTHIVSVVAGMGYGKTEAVSSYLSRRDARVIWFQLSSFDNTPSRLWERLIQLLQLNNKSLTKTLLARGIPKASELSFLLNLLGEALDKSLPTFLVLDDFHLLENPECVDFFLQFAATEAPNLTTIFISRKGIRDGRFQFGEGVLSEVTQQDLRFTANEVADLFNKYHAPVTRRFADDLCRITNGSVLSIQLARSAKLSDVGKKNVRLNEAELIDKEIYQKASKTIQDFMLKLSMLKNIPYDLALLLANHDADLMDQMMKYCSFISQDCFSKDIRIHPLLLEVLAEKQHILADSMKKTLLSNAADWYAKQGSFIDAITYCQRAGEYEKIFELLVRLVENPSMQISEFAISVIKSIPDSYKAKDIRMTLLEAAYTLANPLDIQKAEMLVEQVIKQCENVPQTDKIRELLGEAYILRAGVSLFSSTLDQNYRFLEDYQRVKEYLPQGSKWFSFRAQFSACSYMLSIRDHSEKALKTYLNVYAQAVPLIASLMGGYTDGAYELMLAEKAYFQNDLANAITYAKKSIAKAERSSQNDIKELGAFYLVRAYLALGRYSAAKEQLGRLKFDQMYYDYFNTFDVYHGWFYTMIQKPEEVALWLTGKLNWNHASPFTFAFDRLVRARYYLSSGNYSELLAYLDAKPFYSIEDFFVGNIEMKLIKAIALRGKQKYKAAQQAFFEAYECALPNNITRPFIENGRHTCQLAKLALRLGDARIPKDWLKRIMTEAHIYEKKLAQAGLEYRMEHREFNAQSLQLTSRELEVLTDLCHTLTSKEIAANNQMSEKDVGRLLKSIYRKLGACNKANAVYRATVSHMID